MENKKYLEDFENEEQFLEYLVGEIEEKLYDENNPKSQEFCESDYVDSFNEFFIAHSRDIPVTRFKIFLYEIANKYLGYDLKID